MSIEGERFNLRFLYFLVFVDRILNILDIPVVLNDIPQTLIDGLLTEHQNNINRNAIPIMIVLIKSLKR